MAAEVESAVPVKVQDEVADALSSEGAVVALESTIISHGMPWPKNFETALAVEQEVRKSGAVPATVAILDGQLRVGLDQESLERLARTGQEAIKCSRRDLAAVLQSGGTGATTVAATMIVARLAGIRVFATGGIGGVHRGATDDMDVSADLQELARTPVAVVCAGPKAILDIGLTLEYLETHGVPVVGYGCDELPAFYSRQSGHPVDYRLDDAKDLAQLLSTHWDLGLGGAVIANPVPEEFALDAALMEQQISAAVAEAEQRGISGKNLTPFLLERMEQLSGGRSLQTNIELVLNNARLAAAVARELNEDEQ